MTTPLHNLERTWMTVGQHFDEAVAAVHRASSAKEKRIALQALASLCDTFRVASNGYAATLGLATRDATAERRAGT